MQIENFKSLKKVALPLQNLNLTNLIWIIYTQMEI